MSSISEPLRSQIEEAASQSPNMNLPNNHDPADEDSPAEAGLPISELGGLQRKETNKD